MSKVKMALDQNKIFFFGIGGPARHLDLFEYSSRFNYRFAFLSTEQASQAALELVIERLHVFCIADLREFPIFKGPSFNHHRTIEYFIRRNVVYLPIIDIIKQENSNATVAQMIRAISKMRSKGLLLILHDKTVSDDLIFETRKRLARRAGMLELHPRTLTNQERGV